MSIAIMFPGQGAQYPGMCRDFYEAYPLVRESFLEAEEASGLPMRELCFEGPREKLDLTEYTQPCLLTCEVALYRLLAADGIAADMAAGFSLGEWSALIAAEVLPFGEGLRLVQQRARLMQSAVPLGQGGMLAVLKQEEAAVRALCEDAGTDIWPANFNCPGQIVCAGRTEALDRAEALAAERGIMCMRLPVSIPSHCPLMQTAADGLQATMKETTFDVPRFPVLRNVDARPCSDRAALAQGVILQLTKPVLYEASLRNMAEAGANTFIEVGPGKTLSGFVKRTLKGVDIYRMDSVEAYEKLKAALLG